MDDIADLRAAANLDQLTAAVEAARAEAEAQVEYDMQRAAAVEVEQAAPGPDEARDLADYQAALALWKSTPEWRAYRAAVERYQAAVRASLGT